MGLVKARSVAEVAVAAGAAYLTDDIRIVVDVRANPQSGDDWGFAFRPSSGVGKKDSPLPSGVQLRERSHESVRFGRPLLRNLHVP